MKFADFLIKIQGIKQRGFLPTHRKGPTGIGKTLEDLLGITENNIAGPDFSIYELKTGRKDSGSMLTLFTKSPEPIGANNQLLEKCGYAQRKVPKNYRQITLNGKNKVYAEIPLEEKELHSTVDAIKPNAQNLVLKITDNRLTIWNDKNVEAFYEHETLKAVLLCTILERYSASSQNHSDQRNVKGSRLMMD